MGVRLPFDPIFNSWTPKYRVKVTPEKMRFFWRGVWESFFYQWYCLPSGSHDSLVSALTGRTPERARARTSNEQLPRPERYTYKVLLLVCGECDSFKHHAWWTPSLSSEAAKARVEVSWPVANLRGGGTLWPSWTAGALIRWMQFLYVTASFLVEGAQIHEIGSISPHKTPAIKN